MAGRVAPAYGRLCQPTFSGIDEDASAEIVAAPLLLLLGLGIGALASQLGSVTVSAGPDDLSPEVGGLQNTATNTGASLRTALAASVLIASLTATLVAGIRHPASGRTRRSRLMFARRRRCSSPAAGPSSPTPTSSPR